MEEKREIIYSDISSTSRKKPYDAMVYLEGGKVIAVDSNGKVIARGIAGEDDTAVIQAAIDDIGKLGGSLHIKHGTYILTNTLYANYSNIEIRGDGDATVIDGSHDGAPITAFRVNGNESISTHPVIADVVAGQRTIAVETAAGVSVGDWIRIRSDAVYLGEPSDTKKGEMQRVSAVDYAANIITVSEYLMDGYLVSDTATVDRMRVYENISIRDIRFVGRYKDADQTCNSFRQVSNLKIQNVTFDNWLIQANRLTDVAVALVSGCKIIGCENEGLGYGVSIANSSRDVIISNNTFSRCWHAVATGGNHTYGVNRNIIMDGNTVHGSSELAGAFNTHATSENVVISNNTVYNDRLADLRSPRTIVIGNTCISTRIHTGISIYYRADDVDIINNKIYTASTAIDIRGNQRGIRIRGNTITTTRDELPGILSKYGSSDVIIDGNAITSNYHAIQIFTQYAQTETQNITIQNNVITNTNPNDIRQCISVGDAYGKDISNVTIRNNTFGGRGISIQLTFASAGIGRHISIAGNTFSGSANLGIYVRGTNYSNLYVNNNEFNGIAAGIKFLDAVESATISNNKFADVATPLVDYAKSAAGSGNIGYTTENSGSAPTVADGGTIAHGCVKAPTKVTLTGSVAGEIVTVTSIDATNITVAIKKPDGSAGTPQTIYWRAEV